MKKMIIITAISLFAAQVFACGISGSAYRTDGSRVDGTAKISTDWDSSRTYPRDGMYSLDLGSSACGKRVEVYVNGNSVGSVMLPSSGYANVNVTLDGASDMPVR